MHYQINPFNKKAAFSTLSTAVLVDIIVFLPIIVNGVDKSQYMQTIIFLLFLSLLFSIIFVWAIYREPTLMLTDKNFILTNWGRIILNMPPETFFPKQKLESSKIIDFSGGIHVRWTELSLSKHDSTTHKVIFIFANKETLLRQIENKVDL